MRRTDFTLCLENKISHNIFSTSPNSMASSVTSKIEFFLLCLPGCLDTRALQLWKI